MSKVDCFPCAARVLTALVLLLGSFFFGAPPATANILPEAVMLIHVQPAPPERDSCATTITSCDQIVRTTSAEGLVEFLIFFYPVAHQDYHFPISHLTTNLVWPDTWSFVRWSACGGAEGSLQSEGTSHALSLAWPACPRISGTIFQVASVVLNVTGPGKLTLDPFMVPVWLDCPPDGFYAQASSAFAAAGMECGYSHSTCEHGDGCTPVFNPEELALSARVGEIAEGQAPFAAYSSSGPICPLTAIPDTSWVRASVVQDNGFNSHLVVTADATGLSEGVHHAWIEVKSYAAARCLRVDFTVTPRDPDPVISQSWGRIKDRYRQP